MCNKIVFFKKLHFVLLETNSYIRCVGVFKQTPSVTQMQNILKKEEICSKTMVYTLPVKVPSNLFQ